MRKIQNSLENRIHHNATCSFASIARQQAPFRGYRVSGNSPTSLPFIPRSNFSRISFFTLYRYSALTSTESSFCRTFRMRNTSLATSAICTCLVMSSGVVVLCCDVVTCLEGVTGGVMNFLASSLAAGDRN